MRSVFERTYYKRSHYVAKLSLVRLAALDLDGTLLNRNNEVTLATRRHCPRCRAWRGGGARHRPPAGQPAACWQSCPASGGMPSPPTVPPCGTFGDDPMGAVHSRYANAAQRHTSEPACLLHRLMPTEVAREAFDLFQQYDGELSVFSDGLAIKTPEGIASSPPAPPTFSSEAR